MNTTLLTDSPGTMKADDSFQRYEFAKRIASIVATPKNDKSLIVGLYGRWGEGKTTVMNFIQQELPKETVIVNFNPWLFSDEQHLLKSFFTSMSEALGTSDKTTKEKIGKVLSDYGGAIGSVTQFVGFGTEGLEKLGNKLIDTSTEKLKRRIDELIILSDKNIVVFVDDIDRLDINEIQYVFKIVKLVGDFPRTSYILSFDDEMVSAALSPKYGGDTKVAGYNFLEKIIQIPLKIPKASKKALSKYTLGLINNALDVLSIELTKEEVNDFLEIFNKAFLPFMDNPRLGIRYANTLSFSLPLLVGEVNNSNLMIIEGLKIFYPELYDFIRSNSQIFLNRTNGTSDYGRNQTKKEAIIKEIDAFINRYNDTKKKIVIEMLEQLFPQLKAIYGNIHYTDTYYTKWTNEKRICSGRYFDRYFSYTVQEGDVPDTYFDQLLLNLELDSEEAIVWKLSQAVEQYSAFDIILKLRMREESLTETQSMSLILALSKIGHTFPVEQDFHFATTYAQAASLISRVVMNVPKPKQLFLILKLLSETKSLEYSMEINYWLMYREKKDPDNSNISEEDEIKIQEHLVFLFQEGMTDENFFTTLSDGNLWRVLSWWSKSKNYKKSLKTFLNKHLKKKNNSQFALSLLKVFTPSITSRTWGSNELHTYKNRFYITNFEEIKKVVDVLLLNENLIFEYGMNPSDKEPTTISDRDPIDDKTLISVFQWFVINDK